jgi:cytochrome b
VESQEELTIIANFDQSAAADGISPPATVKVWDPLIRIFHWSLVALFAIAFPTGDEVERLHLWAGYAIAALVALRLVWGFIGPLHARFADFVKGPRAVATFLKQSARLEAPRHMGHNTAGGIMIIALLAALVGLTVTGLLMTTDTYWGSEVMEKIHEAIANATLVLIALHVIGVIVASIEHGENLVMSMLTGRKRPR